MEIIPTILEKDFDLAENRFSQVKDFSPWVQIDVIDNIFTSGKSFELELISKLNHLKPVLWDIHLMVKEPINWIKKCLFVGAYRISGQVEMMSDRNVLVTEIKNLGLEAGLAFDIDTPLGNIPNECDLILLMARKAGFSHCPLDNRIYQKIVDAKKYGKKVAIDGGVDPNNFFKIKKSGADLIYSGQSFLDLINEKEN